MTTPELAAMGDEQFVSLATFRRNGEAVPTPVWIAREGGDLVVTTPAGSGKVKRLRNDPTVTLRPCSRRGKVADDASTVPAQARIDADPASAGRATAALAAKYGVQFKVMMLIEKVLPGSRSGRELLRISPVGADGSPSET